MSLRVASTLLTALALVNGASAQSVLLKEETLVDSCHRVKLTLDLRGKVSFQNQGKTETVEHNAAAEHVFAERVLEAKGAVAEKTARHYEIAKATIAGQTRTLRATHSLVIAHRVKDQLISYSPKGPLFGEEMELLEHFDTLSLPGLLPGTAVKVGDSWNVAPAVVQGICGLDGLDAQTKQQVTCTLTALTDDRALVTIQGTVKGIQLGASVSVHIDAKSQLLFDLQTKRIVQLDWRQSDERQQGPATPNLAADVTIKLERRSIPTPNELGQFALLTVPDGPPPARLTKILHRDPKGKFEFQRSREWQDVGEHNGQRVLKLVTARGDHLADAVLAPWTGPKIDSAQAFKLVMDETPGWKQDGDSQLDDAVKHPHGYTVYRVAAAGKMEGVPAFRMAYLIGNASGQQLLVTFIAPPNQVNSLETRDQTLVDSVEFK
ncbi:MAG: hypothetical protein L0Y71_07595 [Gemmataceae bacterium]|nr:hypothetical protein [Gemmataceae bacterium]